MRGVVDGWLHLADESFEGGQRVPRGEHHVGIVAQCFQSDACVLRVQVGEEVERRHISKANVGCFQRIDKDAVYRSEELLAQSEIYVAEGLEECCSFFETLAGNLDLSCCGKCKWDHIQRGARVMRWDKLCCGECSHNAWLHCERCVSELPTSKIGVDRLTVLGHLVVYDL